MPIRDDGNKPHSALVEKYTNREYSSLIKKNAEPQPISKARTGGERGSSSNQNNQIISKLRNSYNNGQVVLKPNSPSNNSYNRNLVMIPHKGNVVNQPAPVSAYIAVSPKSNQTANQYKYTGQLVYKDGSPINRS